MSLARALTMTGQVASVFVVIVNFRTGPLTVECLASLAAGPVASWLGPRVIVVDNCSEDDSVTQISSAIRRNGWGAWGEVFAMPRNGGFAYGNNAAIARARQIDPDLAAVVLLNPDTVVRPGTLSDSSNSLNSHRARESSAPRSKDGQADSPCPRTSMPSPLGELEASARIAP